MKTLICQHPEKIEYIERDMPELKAGEALLKIRAVGICGTDIHAFAGRQPFFSYPRVLGHEICGVVEETGSDCHRVKKGRRYSVIPCVPCGVCMACQEGKTNCCENVSLYGVHQDGGFSEYLAVREENLVELPPGLSDNAGALVECFAIGAHAVRRAEIKSQQNVLVVGAGPIGLAAAAIAKAKGARVVVADIDAGRRQQITDKLGLQTLDPIQGNYLDALKTCFDGQLACTLLDATGNKSSMSRSVDLIGHGGKIVFIGLYIGELVLDDPTFHKKETTLLASRNATREDFECVIAFMTAGVLPEKLMVNKEYDFYSFGHRYKEDVVENKSLVKGVIKF
ncbi:zinc-binding alcohol dehydrogenase family protein [Leclercia adecarboxylata]|uniref:zinc-binding alcohol dehydrogenase family protein n=1 Tax=Leclercia adecarboxylata TaxID=83655 RepID=UPI00202A5386|nr:zinc-binding alcohol dehydrogenase family protein [Leclercia adecarboxylata]URN99323.1 zinc-binding alcohol dehydrogenase family protein [Leclercia adecarboxylata]